MSLGTSVDPVTIEQIHFYKSRFGEQPPTKKFSLGAIFWSY